MSLKVWKKFISEWGPIGHPFPTSMPTTAIRSLQEASKLALEEGLDLRYRRHEVASLALREGCRVLGLEPFVRQENRSKTVTVLKVPAGHDAKIREELDKRFNIMIGGGMGEMRGRVVRIATMGVTASPFYVLPTLEALEVLVREFRPGLGAGVAVAQAASVFEEWRR